MQIIIGNSIGVNRTSTLGGEFEYTAIDNNFSMEFDGVDDYVDLVEIAPRFVTSTGDANTEPWSVSMWVNFDASANNVFIQLPLGTINRTWSLLFTASKIAFGHRYETAIVTENGSTAINSNQWNHIAVTFDGVDKSLLSSWKLFINGSPIVITTRSHFGTNDSGELTIGKIFTNIYGNNKTDEVALWNTALSEGTIEAIYNTTNDSDAGQVANLLETPEGAPVAWYRFE